MLRCKHVIVISFYNNIWKTFFRMKRDKVDLPKSNTKIIYTPIIEWFPEPYIGCPWVLGGHGFDIIVHGWAWVDIVSRWVLMGIASKWVQNPCPSILLETWTWTYMSCQYTSLVIVVSCIFIVFSLCIIKYCHVALAWTHGMHRICALRKLDRSTLAPENNWCEANDSERHLICPIQPRLGVGE